jgi:hypothetical protein
MRWLWLRLFGIRCYVCGSRETSNYCSKCGKSLRGMISMDPSKRIAGA